MESKKEARLNMFHAVIALCDGNPAIIALVAAFFTAYSSFKTTVTAIVAAAAQLEAQTGGYAISKKGAKKGLAEFGSGIAGLVYAYASAIDDDVLKEAMNISYSDITHAKDDDAVTICNNILAAATTNLGNLADYGVTAAVLGTFQTTIEDYANKVPKPRGAVNIKKGVRKQMNILFRDATKIADERMDKIAVQFLHNGNAEFHGAYESARIIIDPGTFKTVVQLKVLNMANDEPLIYVKSYRDTSTVAKRSSTKGVITYKDAAEGKHVFVLKKKGFKDTTAEVIAVHGKHTTLVVKMEMV